MIQQWRALETWITTEATEGRHSHHLLTSLREAMTARRETISVAGDFGGWTPITVHLDGEISARDRSTPYKGAMFAAYPGDVVFSKIDARSGAIGVLPSEIAKAVVTSEFPVFVADPARLDSRFLKLVLRTGGFLAALRSKATGTSGRKRITPAAFLDLRIPLPSIEEQRRIMSTYEVAVLRAAELEQEANKTETAATKAFEAALGFGPSAPLPDQPMFVASFKALDRWSHEGILRRLAEGTAIRTPTYPIVQLRDVIANLENGWSPKCHNRRADDDEWGVLKLGAISFGTFDDQQNKALPKHLKPRPTLQVKPGQILISRANITRLVGAIVLIEKTRRQLMLCDKIFRVIYCEPSPVQSAFLTEVLRINNVRRQIESRVTGTSPTMKNISKPSLLSLTFPLPPIEQQQTLVKALSDSRAKAIALHNEAAEKRAKAWTDFEAALYAADDKAKAAEGGFGRPVPNFSA